MTRTGYLRLIVGCAVIALAVSVASAALAQGADDDWVVVDRTTTTRQTPQDRAAAAAASAEKDLATPQTAKGAPPGVFVACGEPARPAQEPYKSIVATLNQMWGTHAKVYESITPMSPHASTGGCIFYNIEFQDMLTSRWMGITDDDQLRPILYAIYAHELGHIIHGDLSPRRANVPLEQKELEADRFAGYTLWRLNVQRASTPPIPSATTRRSATIMSARMIATAPARSAPPRSRKDGTSRAPALARTPVSARPAASTNDSR